MTKEDIKRICTIYDNLRNEQNRGTIAYNSEDTFFEHVLATYKTIEPYHSSNIDKAAREYSANLITGELDPVRRERIAFKAGAEWMANQRII